MIWRNVIKELAKASLPTIVIPAVVVVLIIRYFGFTLESLTAVMFLSQIYIIWAQLEVALRQAYLTDVEYEPEFNIEIEESKEHWGYYIVKVRNVGRHAAWSIFIQVSVIPLQEPGKEKHVFKPLTSLAPGEAITLDLFSEETLSSCNIKVELDYQTKYGELRTEHFTKYPVLPLFIRFPPYRKKPGVLLNSLEELSSILNILAMLPRSRKYQVKIGELIRAAEEEKLPNKQPPQPE